MNQLENLLLLIPKIEKDETMIKSVSSEYDVKCYWQYIIVIKLNERLNDIEEIQFHSNEKKIRRVKICNGLVWTYYDLEFENEKIDNRIGSFKKWLTEKSKYRVRCLF